MPVSESFPRKRASNLTTIKCECGQEILIVPDVNEMSRAIEAHAEEHQKTANSAEEGISNFERIQNLLIKQLLETISSKDKRK